MLHIWNIYGVWSISLSHYLDSYNNMNKPLLPYLYFGQLTENYLFKHIIF